MTKTSFLAVFLAAVFLVAGNVAPFQTVARADESSGDTTAGKAGSRTFQLDYGFEVDGLHEGDEVKMWLPIPQSDRHQQIEILSRDLPGVGSESREPKYGNKMIYRALKVGDKSSLSAKIRYQVQRREVTAESPTEEQDLLSEIEERLFLSPNAMVPIADLPIKWLIASDKFSVARQIYDRVDEHVRYDKSEPGYGNGDVLWVCDSRFGNCTDFHSLFIAMARASKIPARFEIGFPLPTDKSSGKIGGYHCWASFYDSSRGWFPVDISEADKHPELKEYFFGNLSPDRIRFTKGRDIDLVPKQSSPPLNYFVYPHVEINGKLADQKQVSLQFAFQNVAPNADSNE
ncbi:transglutaminase-like domain-containing protein [Stieleria marina]|uniref:transglutaminase-like domain-containing protein n=1 Tax=Stieleria marina TaxID=1930275 RepID=UPI003AF37ADB